MGCKFSHTSSKVENEKISDDQSKNENHWKNNTTTMEENDENKLDHRNDKFHDSDCQGCGQFPYEFECDECSDRFCSECVQKDHMTNLHFYLNCGDDDV